MVEPLQLPEIPPDGPWSAYVLVIIWLPLLFRIMFLLFPFRRALARLVPHTKWALKALRELPIKGIGLLVFERDHSVHHTACGGVDTSVLLRPDRLADMV